MHLYRFPTIARHCVIVSLSTTAALRIRMAMEMVLGSGRITTIKDQQSLEENVHRTLARPDFDLRRLLFLDYQTSAEACGWYMENLGPVVAKSMSDVICFSDEPAQSQLGQRLNSHIAAILPLPRDQIQAHAMAKFVAANWS